jgi:TRAP-type C4-dicarboxylate transport system permease small subunit
MDKSLIGRVVYGLAGTLAFLGGVALVVITVTTVLSIAGRLLVAVGLRSIHGDVEIVQAGMLFAILAFMPWTHLTRGHAIVAILTDRFPVRFNAVLEFATDIAMLVVALFITWRFWAGMLDKLANRESTFIMRIPIGWIYASGMIGLSVFVLVAAYCVVRSGRNAFSAIPARPIGGGAE